LDLFNVIICENPINLRNLRNNLRNLWIPFPQGTESTVSAFDLLTRTPSGLMIRNILGRSVEAMRFLVLALEDQAPALLRRAVLGG
jgi:hypothetical protein